MKGHHEAHLIARFDIDNASDRPVLRELGIYSEAGPTRARSGFDHVLLSAKEHATYELAVEQLRRDLARRHDLAWAARRLARRELR